MNDFPPRAMIFSFIKQLLDLPLVFPIAYETLLPIKLPLWFLKAVYCTAPCSARIDNVGDWLSAPLHG